MIEADAPETLSQAEQDADSIGSYYAAVAAIGELIRAGEPVPAFMLPQGQVPS